MYYSILLSSVLALYAIYKNKVSPGGTLLAWIIGIIIAYFGGFYAFIALFLITILSDKLKSTNEDKTRNVIQIISNILPAALSIILYYLTNNNIFYIIYYCTIAASLSDTLASSVGTLSKKDPINIFTLKQIPKGESGGVSYLGLFISLVGGVIIGSIYLLSSLNIVNFAIISIMGFTGSLIDSILGIIVEVQYKCSICDKITEEKTHCKEKTNKIKGFSLVDNNMVNLLSNILILIISYLILIP